MFKASVNTMVKLAQSIRDTNVLMNPHQEALSEIQKAKSRTCYIDFDIDAEGEKLYDALKSIKHYVNNDAVTLLKTRGGVHALIDPTKVSREFKNSFYQNISKISSVDQSGDQLIPLPGTYQGGFTPTFIL